MRKYRIAAGNVRNSTGKFTSLNVNKHAIRIPDPTIALKEENSSLVPKSLGVLGAVNPGLYPDFARTRVKRERLGTRLRKQYFINRYIST